MPKVSCAPDQPPKVEVDEFDYRSFEQHMFAKAMPNLTARSSGRPVPTKPMKPRRFELTEEGLTELE